MWAGFAVSQLYLAARLWVRLVFVASEVSLFQNRLAGAGYIAVPLAPLAEPAPSIEPSPIEAEPPSTHSRAKASSLRGLLFR